MLPFFQTNVDPQDFPAPAAPSIIPLSQIHPGFVGVPDLPTGSTVRQFGSAEDQDEALKVRKFMHREIERRRRQEMVNLCGSLRTLIPLEYIKGKRSMSENMMEAVNYIKDMESDIHQLKARRDSLLKKSSGNYNHWSFRQSNEENSQNYAAVNPCLNGVEILINTSYEYGQGFPLSRILAELTNRGFDNIVSCISTRAESRLLHRIQLEARNHTYEDLCGLEKGLTFLITCPFRT